jgi:cytochrome c-type biogenesis protein
MSIPSVITVFVAGMLAFASPCVLPLLPGYLAFMSGELVRPQRTSQPRQRTVVVALAFVVGFGAVFVALGATASGLGAMLLIHRAILERVGGAAIAVIGLSVLGVLRVPLLSCDFRLRPTASPGVAGSVLLGATFALGWSPCIGPTLAAALAIAAGQDGSDPWQGALLLAVYSAGLGAPFILLAVGSARVKGPLRALQRHGRAVNVASGVLLVVVGILMGVGEFSSLSSAISRATA